MLPHYTTTPAIVRKFALGATLCIGLPGCSGLVDDILPDVTQNESATSGFSLAASDNTVATQLLGITEGAITDFSGVGYAYKGGTDANGEYATLATLVGPAIAVTNPVGTAQFTGTAHAIYANTNRTFQNNVAEQLSSPISVTADLGSGAFLAQTTPGGPDPLDLRFTGAYANGQLVGTGEFTNGFVDIDTTLVGKMDDFRAVAAFHGSGNAIAIAGGFYASRVAP